MASFSSTSSSTMLSGRTALSLVVVAASVAAQQPSRQGSPNTFEIVGQSGVSAQMMFLGTSNKVYILDKTENNPIQVAGHPAWATEYDIASDNIRSMDILTNSFCAGGGVLGNGTWLNVGGNQAVTWGGDGAPSQTGGAPYQNWDGGRSIRILSPCDDENCNWVDLNEGMSTRRWYPTLETLEDGSLIIIGGNQWGGFVNSAGQNNPTYEYYPSRGAPVGLNILTTTLPANLFPLTWLLPSGNLFIQTNWGTEIFDYKANVEYPLPDMIHAVRTYPASAGSVMLPLTPANGYTATIMFCGGSDLEPDQWVEDWAIAQYPADNSCVKMSPDTVGQWETDDSLPEGRAMGSLILLPDQTAVLLNGANTGVAGYGNVSWAIGHSYADSPIKAPLIYNPSAPLGSRWSRDGITPSTVNRMYHSSAVLLPDGSIFVSGSNPNPDYRTDVPYPTEYRTERFYPWYFNKRRPEPQGLPDSIGYGGQYAEIKLTKADLNDDVQLIKKTKAVIVRPGFSTHAINMGQRLAELESSYTVDENGDATLHVSQLPDRIGIFPPGPAMLFVTVDGVPSIGHWVMVGNGRIGEQETSANEQLPESSIPEDIDKPDDTTTTPGKSGATTLAASVSMIAIVSAGLALHFLA